MTENPEDDVKTNSTDPDINAEREIDVPRGQDLNRIVGDEVRMGVVVYPMGEVSENQPI